MSVLVLVLDSGLVTKPALVAVFELVSTPMSGVMLGLTTISLLFPTIGFTGASVLGGESAGALDPALGSKTGSVDEPVLEPELGLGLVSTPEPTRGLTIIPALLSGLGLEDASVLLSVAGPGLTTPLIGLIEGPVALSTLGLFTVLESLVVIVSGAGFTLVMGAGLRPGFSPCLGLPMWSTSGP